jgi:hypothetical protein
MKFIACFMLVFIAPFYIKAQSLQTGKKKGLPAFDILLADGSHFTVADLKKNLPVMFVYFDPDCDHCELFINELLKQINAFKDVQIIMVTYVPAQALKGFVNKLGLSKYNDIKVGTEGNHFVVRYHYNVVQFPYLALHDKAGNLFATYESEVPTPLRLSAMFKM